MKVLKAIEALQNVKQPLVLTIGKFDGIHKGHQAVLNAALDLAQQQNALCAVLTFDLNPHEFFAQERASPLLLPSEEKRSFLEALRVDILIEQPFSSDFAALSPQQFLTLLEQSIPYWKGIVVGNNFQFGANRQGDVNSLSVFAQEQDIPFVGVDVVLYAGKVISSTRIRKCLSEGKEMQAYQMLGKDLFEKKGPFQVYPS